MLKKRSIIDENKANMAIQSVARQGSPAEATEPPKTSRISFSVASILADKSEMTGTAEMMRHHRSDPESPLRQSPMAQPSLPGGQNSRPLSQTPPLDLHAPATSSEDEYEDSVEHEDSIVDVEDLNNAHSDDESQKEKERAGPIRPTPFSALAAAAAAYHGLGWPGAPPVHPFGPLFPSHLPVGHITGNLIFFM